MPQIKEEAQWVWGVGMDGRWCGGHGQSTCMKSITTYSEWTSIFLNHSWKNSKSPWFALLYEGHFHKKPMYTDNNWVRNWLIHWHYCLHSPLVSRSWLFNYHCFWHSRKGAFNLHYFKNPIWLCRIVKEFHWVHHRKRWLRWLPYEG